jgi:hypothetical protein
MAPLAGARLLRPTTTLQREESPDAAPTLTLPRWVTENQGTLVQRELEGAPTLTDDSAPTLMENSAPTLTLPQRGRENSLAYKEDGRLPLAPSRGISVQASSDDTAHPDPPPQEEREILQGAWYAAPVAVSRVHAGAPAPESSSASAGPHQASETEMDELARKLYDRLRNRLKTELLVDRERAGFLTDLR